MKAVISPSAEIAFVMNGEDYLYKTDSKEGWIDCHPCYFTSLFSNCNDMIYLEDITLDEVETRLQREVECQDAFRIASIVIDSDVEQKLRCEGIRLLEKILQTDYLKKHIDNYIGALVKAEINDISSALNFSKDLAPNVTDFLEKLYTIHKETISVKNILENK